ncbi:hypothetical protein [Methanolobus sp.]|uniref:hypothetical protein n=1 Tax=Methanolobus sp. TaxID=1874737 RepID=UPI0025E74428|nr:hypothetical protein [Methanolobus sp.]
MVSIVRIQELIKNAGCPKCGKPIDHVWFCRNDYMPCEPIFMKHLAPRICKLKPVYGTYRICVSDSERHKECKLLNPDFKIFKNLNLKEIQNFMQEHTCPKCGDSIDILEINIGDKSRKENVKLIHVSSRHSDGSIYSYSECFLNNNQFYDMMI